MSKTPKLPSHFALAAFLALPLASSVCAQRVSLSFAPVDASYSRSLDRIVMVSASPNRLHFYNAATNSDQTVALTDVPLCLSVSPDGTHAAVLSPGTLFYVNLATLAVEKTFPAPSATPFYRSPKIVLTPTYIYIIPPENAETTSINIATGTSTSTGTTNSSGGQYDPATGTIYSINNGPGTLFKYGAGGVLSTPIELSYLLDDRTVCGPLALSVDGSRLYTACGSVLKASTDPLLDMTYIGTLIQAQLQSLFVSSLGDRVAVIPQHNPAAQGSPLDNQVWLFETSFLNQIGTFALADFTGSNNTSYQAHGQYAFFDQSGTNMFVIVLADSTSGLSSPWAVDTLPLASPGSCAVTISGQTGEAPGTGTVGSRKILADAACVFTAISQSPWISLATATTGSGNQTLNYIVRPNSGAARTGTISVNGTALTVNQSAGPPVSTFQPLSFNVLAADYSKALDSLVAVSTVFNELHVYSPATGADKVIPLPAPPTSVSVAPNGMSAAVGYDGWVSLLNLDTATLTKTIPISDVATNVGLGGTGYIYSVSHRALNPLLSIDSATNAIVTTSNSLGASGATLRVAPSGAYLYAGALSYSGPPTATPVAAGKFDITQGVAKFLYPATTNYQPGLNFWLTADGTLLINNVGEVYSASASQAADFTPAGTLSSLSGVAWATSSANLIAAIDANYSSTVSNPGNRLLTYDRSTLSEVEQILFPQFSVGNQAYTSHGQYAFWNSAGTTLYTVLQADTSAGLASSNAVAVLAPRNSATCTFTLSPTSFTFDFAGGSSIFSVATQPGCSWSAQTTAWWITLQAAFGSGSGSFTATVPPNPYSTPKQDTISLLGQVAQVAQPGSPALQWAEPPADLPQTSVGSHSALGMSVINTSTSAAHITGITSTDPAFSGTNNCGGTVPAGGACILAIQFAPTVPGEIFANVQIAGDFAGAPTGFPVRGLAVSGSGPNGISTGTVKVSGDFDGDRKSDVAVWRELDQVVSLWYIVPSSNPAVPIVQTWGRPGDVPVPGDYDGDGRTDLAVWRPSTGTWFILPSGNPGTPIVVGWGQSGDVPVAGDFDGDGKTDLAVWRPTTGTWFILPSSNPSNPIVISWGASGDAAVPGDYDGDGKTDIAIWRPSAGLWFILPSSRPATPVITPWGTNGDMPVVGDYDGDGKSDLAVWRPSSGTWFILPSGNPSSPVVTSWGVNGDIPLTSDFNGDHMTDLTVWRPSSGGWFVIPSGASTPTLKFWGTTGDTPL